MADYTKASADEVDSVVPEEVGSMRFLRQPLETDELGVTLLDLEPDREGKEHDHADDGQEEVYLVIEGEVEVEFEDDVVELGPGDAVRVGAETTRQIHNPGDERVRLVLVGSAPAE